MEHEPDLNTIDNGWKHQHQVTEEDISTISNCYCPHCGNSNGTTRLLPTTIPMFREIIIMALECPDCHFANSEINCSGTIQPCGETLTLTVSCNDDLNRQVIKSDSATFTMPALEFEIPPSTQRGTLSTIEGILKTAANNLSQQQAERLQLGDVDNFYRCKHVIETLLFYATGERIDEEEDDDDDDDVATTQKQQFPFTIILDDPAGNSFIEKLQAPPQSAEPQLRSRKYYRTPTQDMALGLQPSKQAIQDGTIDDTNPNHKSQINIAKPTISTAQTIQIDKSLPNIIKDDNNNNQQLGRQEVMQFETPCPNCAKTNCETNMCVTDIPHFKEVIIMSLVCEHCGYKSNEIKAGGAIPPMGNKITLRITSPTDLERHVLLSDTAGVTIPELDLELQEGSGGLNGTGGGLYTTVEGLIQKLHQRLQAANPFLGGGDSITKQHVGRVDHDEEKTTTTGGPLAFSQPDTNHVRYQIFLNSLLEIANGTRNLTKHPISFIITDPLANSFVGPIPPRREEDDDTTRKDGNKTSRNDNYVDPNLIVEQIPRTMEQNEWLGLNDIQTENYTDTKNEQ